MQKFFLDVCSVVSDIEISITYTNPCLHVHKHPQHKHLTNTINPHIYDDADS